MPLAGVTVGEIRDALRAAFNRAELEMLLVVRMSESLDDMTGPNTTMLNAAFDVVMWCEREGRTTDLVRAAYAERPANPAVAALYQKYGLTPEASLRTGNTAGGTVPVAVAGFEKTISARLPQLDFGVWLARMAEVEVRVCRVEVGGSPAGTGFLVGPDAVLTNYHVLEDVLAGRAPAADVACRFDYKVLATGARLEGVVARLHPTDWLLASSPYAPAERTATPDSPPPTAAELDYALVRLGERFGEKPRGGPGAPPRGWLALPAAPAAFVPDMPLMIAQHPDGGPLKLAVDTESVIAVTAGGLRVRYRTNTEPGSSGSPVFDLGWNPVALHHLGDPAWDVPPAYNQGVPLDLIRRHIAAAGAAAAAAVEAASPAALPGPEKAAAAATPDTEKAVWSVREVAKLLREQPAQDAIRTYEGWFGEAADSIREIYRYKKLHDNFHIAAGPVGVVVSELGRLRAPADGGPERIAFDDTLGAAAELLVESLQMVSDYVETAGFEDAEVTWRDRVTRATADLTTAAAGRDGVRVARVIERVQKLIGSALPTLNRDIVRLAKRLSLWKVAEGLRNVYAGAAVAGRVFDDGASRRLRQFDEGVGAVIRLDGELGRLLDNHNWLQEIHVTLGSLDIDRAPDIGAVADVWDDVTGFVARLHPSGPADRTGQLVELAGTVKAALAPPPASPAGVRLVQNGVKRFGLKLDAAFDRTDFDLRNLCERLQKLGEALRDTLRELQNV